MRKLRGINVIHIIYSKFSLFPRRLGLGIALLFISLLLTTSMSAAGISVSEGFYTSAQQPVISEHYSTKQGLPSDAVYCSIKDRDGFMWFGTWYGLSRFDGARFLTYNQRTVPGSAIPPRKIQSIVEDSNGNLWLKTADWKLYVFYRETELFSSVYEEIKPFSANLQIIKIQQTDDGNILLLTKDKMLLLAGTNSEGRIWIQQLFDSSGKVNPHSFQLNKSVLSETATYISWIGQDNRVLNICKGEKLQAKPQDYITKCINGDADFTCACSVTNSLYIGNSEGLLFSIDAVNGNIAQKSLPERAHVSVIHADHNGNVYALTSNGSLYVWRKTDGEISKLPLHGSLNFSSIMRNKRITHMKCDKYDNLWFYESGVSLISYNPQTHEHKRFPITYNNDFNSSLYMEEAGDQGLFILTPAGNALFFDRESQTMHDISDMTKTEEIKEEQHFSDIYIDNDGLVWLSSLNNGIYRFNFPKQQFALLPLPNNDKSGVRNIFQMHNGNILVGTRSRNVYIYNVEGDVEQILPYDKYGIGAVYYAMEDNKGNLWLSTKGDGLVKVSADSHAANGFSYTHYKNSIDNPASISGNNVYVTYIDSNDNFWVGTLDGGLNLMAEKDGKTIFYNKNNGFNNYPAYGLYTEIRNMVEDDQQRLWIGTIDGLMSLNTKFSNIADIKFDTYRQPGQTSFANSDVYTLYKDNQNQIWVGAFGGGLSRLTGYDTENGMPQFQALGENDGLRNDVILSMTEDRLSRIWFATEGGLSCYDKKAGRIRNFDRYDGLPQLKMEETAAMLDRNGQIWMGSQQGLLVFNPQKVQTNTTDYPTYIVGYSINNKHSDDSKHLSDNLSISYTDQLQLEYNQEILTIEYSALNFKNYGNVTYRYRLDGYEKEWHYSGQNRIAGYTNLPPGSYTFHVEAIDESNPTLQSAAHLNIKVLPPWWLTWWAKIIYFLLAIALLYGIMHLTLLIMRMRNDVYIGQRLAELKIKFFTNISHELRTPLTLIQGSIQELKNESGLSSRGKEYVSMMEKNSSQMIQLVNQILDFRKIQNGKMRLHVSQTDINELLQQQYSQFHILAEEQEISFDIQPADSPLYVWADKERLASVVRNILANAFKFTPTGGSIYASAGLLNESGRAYIRIEDTGIGIPADKLEDIFERFSQADNSKMSQYQGTGIGLALSKEIIELHHGKIYADRGVDSGTVFTVELLLGKEHFVESEVDFYEGVEYVDNQAAVTVEPAEPQKDDADEKVHDGNRPTVLIVDDNKDLCRLLRLQLEPMYNIYTAHDGREGLKKISLNNPDVVVMDQMMPVMDGLQMLSKIRSDFQISHIPVIVLTAKGDEEAKTRAISMGANAYIIKPFNKDYLQARIDQLLKARATFRKHLLATDKQPLPSADDYGNYLEQKDVEFIDSIHEVIEKNMQNSDFNIDTIASTLGLSRSAFFKKVKSLTGFAPVDLIKEFRLRKAAELLAGTDMSMTEIAYKVGFRDSGYFSKCFRKKYDVSPRDFAASKRGVHQT